MKHLSQKNKSTLLLIKAFALVAAMTFSSQSHAQTDIFQMMDRTDLSIQEVEKWADNYFKINGTGQGTGFKQYQRWLYERKFHLDENGYTIKPEFEDKAYHDGVRKMGVNSRAGNTWTELGPQNWSYTSGWNPGVGRITSVAVHPSDTTIIYVSSPGGGIWKSTNSGANWTPLIDFVNSSWMSVFHLCIDPNNQSVIYASLSNGGVLKSTNSGAAWSTTGSGPSFARQVKVHPSNSSIVFAAATNGLWRSTNAGSTWTQVETAHKEDIEFNPLNPNTMYASGSSGSSCVWRSTNNGQTWSAIGSGSGITNTGRTLLAVSNADPAVVYAVQANGSIFGRMYLSTDSGVTYTTTVTGNASAGTNYFGYEPTGTGTTGQATYDMAICANPLNAAEVHIAGIICWRSLNSGTSFTATTIWSYPNSTGYNHADMHALEWVNGTIYSGSDGGIYKSVNRAGDWIDRSAGLGIRQFYRISCAKTDASVITTGAQDNGSSFRRTNGTWVDWLGADGMDNAISPTSAAVAIGTSQYGAIYKTTNSGASRTNLSQPASGNWVTPIVMHPTTADTVYGGWTGVWRSGNGGSSWTNISSSINVTLDVLAVAPSNTRYIYTSKGSTLYRTSDGGSLWTSLTAPGSITSIFVSKNSPSKIWITCNSSTNRVYVSTDMGTNFTNLSSGLPSLSARSVVVDEGASGTVYVGMNIGVYYMDSNTFTWAEHATGLPLVAINEVEIQKSGNKLRVATYGRGVWESDLQNIVFACAVPAGLSSASITNSGATVSWNAVSGAVSYKVDSKLSSDTTWTTVASATTSTSQSLTGLNASTSYDWRIRTNCSASTSNYAQSSFTTLSNCGDPAGLLVGSITSSSAVVSWNTVSGAIDYSVEYKNASSGTWITTTATTSTSMTLSSLSAGLYDWRVKANCSLASGSFVASDFLIYCASAGTSTTAGYVDRVVLGSISRTSTSDGGYYNGLAMSTNLKPGNSYTISLSPGYSGGKKNTYWRVFIDYNRDGDFVDANEQAGEVTYKGTGNTSVSFTVPSTAALGTSRIRVSLSLNAYQTSCAAFASGEVEDYALNLTNTPGQQEEITETLTESLKVYPNPVLNDLKINHLFTTDIGALELKVFDMQGRAVLGQTEQAKIGLNEFHLDVSTLSQGNYILQLVHSNGRESVSFAISRN